MEEFLTKAQRTTTYGAILCFGISFGVFLTSNAHFSDNYGQTGIVITAFLAGGAVAFRTVRQKLAQDLN